MPRSKLRVLPATWHILASCHILNPSDWPKKQIILLRVIPTMTCQNAGLTLISLYIHQVRVGFKFHVSLISFSSLLPPLQPLFVPSSTATICAGLICSCSTALCIVKFTPHICQCPYKKQRPEATSSPLSFYSHSFF